MKLARAGSRKASVQAAFLGEGGVDAAMTLGLELDLKEGTIRSWIGTWAKANGTEPVASTKGTKPTAPVKRPAGRRVYDIGNPDRIGTLVQAGDQVSEIRYDDGHTRFVPNGFIARVSQDE